MSSLLKKYPFSLEALEYETNALEPYISQRTVEIHHGRHLQGYVNGLNAVIEEYPEYKEWTLNDFFRKDMQVLPDIRDSILRNAGGIYNHERYFDLMTPNSKKAPEGDLADAVIDYFGSLEDMKEDLKKAALGLLGSGYVYVIVTPKSWLQIITLSNQDTPVYMDFEPILVLDVWEHAYYLDQQNKRDEYFENWWNLIDWDKAEEIYEKIYEKNRKFEFEF